MVKVNTINYRTPLIIAICMAVIVTILGLYLSLNGSLSAKQIIIRILICIGVGMLFGLFTNAIIKEILFTLSNPKIAATNYAISHTRQALFGN